MSQYFNSTQSVIVKRNQDGLLHAQCSLLSTFQEASAWISADARTFQISAAEAEIYRDLHEKPGYEEYSDLIGVKAYMHTGKKLKDIIPAEHQIARELFSECIKGIIQTEGFVYSERCYPNWEAYLDNWYAVNDKSCYTFSHPKDVEADWSAYGPRYNNLFNRNLIITLQKDSRCNVLSGAFLDTYHELNICLTFDPTNIITEAKVDFIRIPDKICRNSAAHMQHLEGFALTKLDKKKIGAVIGGPEGCTHLVEIVYDACRLAQAAVQYHQEN
jgi:hypothetical protein